MRYKNLVFLSLGFLCGIFIVIFVSGYGLDLSWTDAKGVLKIKRKCTYTPFNNAIGGTCTYSELFGGQKSVTVLNADECSALCR